MRKSTLQRSAILSFTCLLASGSFAFAKDRSITEFSDSDKEKIDWRVVDDGVMGGLSKGKLSISDKGILKFSGKLSLENNGGFSSIRTDKVELDLSDSTGLVARVRGDGRTYQMRLTSDARYRGMEISFMAEFATKKDKWTEVKVPFSEFTGSWRGRSLPDEKFNPADVRRLGFLLADKNPGDFELEVDWIHAFSGSSKGEAGDGKAGNIVETAVADGRFKTLAAALGAAELAELLQGDGPFTVFAPTDKAFAKLPKGTVESLLKEENRDKLQAILKYHVVPGKVGLADALAAAKAETANGESVSIAFSDGKVRVNEAAIIDADIATSNGVIHVIDSVLLPPDKAEEPATDLLGVAKAAGKFETLLAAVDAAGLTDALEGDGPFTILAPSDKAFEALPKGTVEKLLKKENLDQLKSILTYHVISGKVSAGDALNAKSAKTLNGQAVEFAIDSGTFKVNGATIVKTDIAGDNGVIHVIDAVLMPKSKEQAKEKAQAEAGEKKKAKEKVDPIKLIEDAIERGVPTYNDGDPAGCAAIYKECLEKIVADEATDEELRETLGKVLDMSEQADGDQELAWLYRNGLDYAYQQLSQ